MLNKDFKQKCFNKCAEHPCVYCGEPLTIETATVDHILPKVLGGSNKEYNLVLCCESCNKSKGGKLLGESEISLIADEGDTKKIMRDMQQADLSMLGDIKNTVPMGSYTKHILQHEISIGADDLPRLEVVEVKPGVFIVHQWWNAHRYIGNEHQGPEENNRTTTWLSRKTLEFVRCNVKMLAKDHSWAHTHIQRCLPLLRERIKELPDAEGEYITLYGGNP